MDTVPVLTSAPLHLDLHFQLQLTHEGPLPSWRAQLAGAQCEPLRFESLGELIRYLARLDLLVPPPRGIR